MNSMARKVSSVVAIVSELGGARAVAKLAGVTEPAVYNWQRRKHLPRRTYLVLTRALERNGCSAPATLWRMREAAQ